MPDTSAIPSVFRAPGPIHPYLPIATTSVVFPNTSGYTALTATSASDLQAKINCAASGGGGVCGATNGCDTSGTTGYVISMATASAFNYSSAAGLSLPVSTCTTDWIVVMTSGFSVPRDTRLDPSTQTGTIAKLSNTAVNGAVITCATNIPCNNYWILGIELECIPASGTCFGVEIPAPFTDTPADLPSSIIFDHVYAHGHATTGVIHDFYFSGNNIAIVDSWLSDAHQVGTEAQAINGYAGGPFLIQNDFIEGAGENIIFGGANIGHVNNLYGVNPTDVTITKSWSYKPLQWYFLSSNPLYEGIHFTVKNMNEFKMCVRCLVKYNVFQNNWDDGQAGGDMLQNGAVRSDGFASIQSDVSYLYNHVIGGTHWLEANSVDSVTGQTNSYRLEMSNNLWEDVSTHWGSSTSYLTLLAYTQGAIFNHNTSTTDTTVFGTLVNSIYQRVGPYYFSNNITQNGQNGFDVNGLGSNILADLKIALGATQFPTILNNALQGMASGTVTTWNADASGNFAGTSGPAAMSNIGFVNSTSPGGDYRLCTGVNLPASPCAGASTYIAGGANGCQVNADGTGGNANCGADIAIILAQTAGVQTVPSLWPDSLSGGGITLTPSSLTCNGTNTVVITPIAGSNGGSTFVQSGLDVLFRGAIVVPGASSTSSITFTPPTYSSAATITNTALTGNVATYTISVSVSPLKQGDHVTVTGTTNGGGIFNVTNALVAGSNTSIFIVDITNANVTSAADSGTASGTSAVAVSNFGMPLTAPLTCK